jgi:G6PDH family F420-dependent oxidoreductase
MRIGYILSSEEFGPAELLEQARLAEQAGFEGLWISDHFHPWMDAQGQSPFVWSTIGALSQVCGLPVTTAVTCPIRRVHPAIVAQAAATSAVLLNGRFVLGVGTGEALNEHIYGDAWPSATVRLAMLDEAVEVIRRLWAGGFVEHRGRHYTVEGARLYTLPATPPKVYMSGFGRRSIELAGRIADGYLSTRPVPGMVERFRTAGGTGKPTAAGYKTCYARTEDEAVHIAHERWANELAPGELAQVLPSPRHFEQVATLIGEEATRAAIPCGPDPGRHLEALDRYARTGYDELYVNNIGPYWRDFFDLYATEVLPRARR